MGIPITANRFIIVSSVGGSSLVIDSIPIGAGKMVLRCFLLLAEALFNIGFDSYWRWYNGVVVFSSLSSFKNVASIYPSSEP